MAKTAQAGYGVLLAIALAGILITGAILWPRGERAQQAQIDQRLDQQVIESNSDQKLRPAEESDHVRGNPNASITVIEFGDFECPFCARLHPTLSRLVEENDDVSWIYRHFPLSIHSNAFSAAVASECIAQLAGEEAFWDFADKAFSNQRRLGTSFYQEVAQSHGIASPALNTCLKDQSVSREVEKDFEETVRLGGRGTPFVVIISKQGQLIPFSGALPYNQISGLIEQVRNN
jgi:protein-disulfide isomerase